MKKLCFVLIVCTLFLGCTKTYKYQVVLKDKFPRCQNLHFLNQTLGFCIGRYEESGANRWCNIKLHVDDGWVNHEDIGHLLITENGGNDWTEIKPPVYTVELYSFIDRMRGWISGGWIDTTGQCHVGILHTQDGGKTWAVQSLFIANDLFFIDENTGFAVGDNAIIIRTVDGGKNWTQQTIKENNFNVGHEIGNLMKISFHDKNFGMIGGAYSTLLVTEDGGETWDQMVDKSINKLRLCWGEFKHFAIASEKNIWAITDNRQIVHYDGKSWQCYEDKDFNAMGLINNCNSYSYSGFIYDIAFADKLHGWMIGEGHIYYTQNGGKKWNSLPIKINENNDIDFCRDEVAKTMKYKQISVLKDNSCFIAGEHIYGVQTLFKIE